MIRLTDGVGTEPHVTSEDIGIYNYRQFGYDNGYFYSEEGDTFNVEILSNNVIRINGGAGIIGGRRFRILGPEDVTLDSGVTGYKRIDVIYLAHVQDADGIESLYLRVEKGKSTTGTPTAPTVGTFGAIPDLELEYRTPMVQVKFDGVNIVSAALHSSFPVIRSVRKMNEELARKVVVGSTGNSQILLTNPTLTFTDGVATVNGSSIATAYGKTIKYCFAQFISATSTIITSAAVSENVITLKARTLTNAAYSGTISVQLLLLMV